MITQFIDDTVNDVCQKLSIRKDDLLRSLCSDATTARHLCFRLLYDSGVEVSRIATYFSRSKRAVTLALTAFDGRMRQRPYLRSIYAQLKK